MRIGKDIEVDLWALCINSLCSHMNCAGEGGGLRAY